MPYLFQNRDAPPSDHNRNKGSMRDTSSHSSQEKYDPTLCVIRGIEEELGIPRSLIEKAKISFHDFALVCDEGEIGIGCYVDFSDVMPIEQLRLYPGQDKYMEIKELLIVPYPPFYWNPDEYPNFFYKTSLNDIFSTSWESFTTLLYQRCIIRNSNINIYLNPISKSKLFYI